MIEVPNKVKEKFLKENPKTIMVTKAHVEEEKTSRWGSPYTYKHYIAEEFICACEKGHNVVQEFEREEQYHSTRAVCKFCGHSSYSGDIYSEEAAEANRQYAPYRSIAANSAKKANNVVYVTKHREKEHGIEIYVGYIQVKPVYDKDGKIDLVKDFIITYYASYVPGEEPVALKVLKRSNKPVDFFEVFNINSCNSSFRECSYEDAEDFFEFVNNNPVFAQRCGLIDILKGFTKKYNPDAFFVLHLALITKYPVLELLVKMKYTKLYFDILDQTISAGSKANIQNSVKELNKLLNDTTKGSLALKIPQYIGTYLREKSAPLSEYISWCDIYDLENISKENFEKIINSGYFFNCIINNGLSKMPNIMKYGYEFDKLLRYLHKATKTIDTRSWWSAYNSAQNLLADYLEMCDLMDITPDKTPMDLKKAHDDVTEAFRAKENEIQDAKFRELSLSVSNYINRDVEESKKTKMETMYDVVIPASTADFVREGQQQHNCVGSYCRRVLDGRCIVFFVRKKDAPYESYITAEYVNGKLNQCMLKNNIRVNDKDMLNYCQVICNRIKQGIDSKKIIAA